MNMIVIGGILIVPAGLELPLSFGRASFGPSSRGMLFRRTRVLWSAQVVSCLIEGCSIRATVRMTGVAKKTVMRILIEIGEVCSEYQDEVFRNLRCKRLQLDEI